MKIYKYIFCKRTNTVWISAGAIVLLAMLLASAAYGDVIDDSLPSDTPQAVKTSARQAVQSGLDRDSLVRLTRAMLQKQFTARQVQQAHTLMIEAQNSGLPVQPLMNKAFEGMAKGVNPSLVLGAMETVQSRNAFALRQAARLSKNKSQTENLGRVLSTALAAGFAKQDADKITQMLQQRSQTIKSDRAYSLALACYHTARDVSRLGVSSEAVSGMLANALNKGFDHNEMQAMRSAFMAQAQQSQPQDLAYSYSAAIQAGRGFQEGPAGSPGGSGGDAGGPGAGVGSGASGQCGTRRNRRQRWNRRIRRQQWIRRFWQQRRLRWFRGVRLGKWRIRWARSGRQPIIKADYNFCQNYIPNDSAA
jgi:hypothetical protein